MPETQFTFFDDNGEKCEDVIFGGIRSVEKLMESVMSKEFKEKEYDPNIKRF